MEISENLVQNQPSLCFDIKKLPTLVRVRTCCHTFKGNHANSSPTKVDEQDDGVENDSLPWDTWDCEMTESLESPVVVSAIWKLL